MSNRAPLACVLILALGRLTARSEQSLSSPAVDAYGDPLPAGAVARLGTLRFRSGGPNAVSPDAQLIASSDGFDVCLWDFATGNRLREFRGHEGWIRCLAWSPDGRIIASGSDDRTIRFWDRASGKELAQCKGHEGRYAMNHGVKQIMFCPSGKRLVSCGTDNTIRLWDVASGRELRQLMGAKGEIWTVALSSDGKTVAAYSKDQNDDKKLGEIWRWAVDTGAPTHRWLLPDDICMPSFSPDLQVFVTWSRSGGPYEIKIWDAITGKQLRSLRVHPSFVVFAPDGKTLLSAEHKSFRHWDVATGKELRRVECNAERLPEMAFCPDGKTLVSSGGRIRFWDALTGTELRRFEGHGGGVSHVVFSSDGKRLASAEAEEIRVWSVPRRQLTHRLTNHVHWVCGMVFSQDSKHLLSWSPNRVVHRWDVATGRELERTKDRWGLIGALAFSHDVKTAALVESHHSIGADSRDRLSLWDTATWKPLLVPGSALDRLTSPVFSPDGKTVAAGGTNLVPHGDGHQRVGLEGKPKDYAVHRWDVGTGRALPPLGKHARPVEYVLFSPDGRTVAAATWHGLIHLWESATGQQRLLIDPEVHITAMAFSPNGRFLALAHNGRFGWIAADGKDRKKLQWGQEKHWDVIRLWDLATGREVHTFGKHRGGIGGIAFSPDGKLLASGSYDTTVLLWDMAAVSEKAVLKPLQASPKVLESLWADLDGDDAAKANQACWTLTYAPAEALALFRNKLRPTVEADAKVMARLIAELDDSSFAVRQKATRELEKLGVTAKPALRRAVASASLEFRRRAERLLELPEPPPKASLRAIEVLERIGYGHALTLLDRLADGIPEGLITKDARAAVQRLRPVKR